MDQHPPRLSVAERVRIERVARRLDAARFGLSTQSYHRRQQVHQVAFIVLLVLAALGGLFLLAG